MHICIELYSDKMVLKIKDIKKLRLSLRLTQQKLSEISNVSQSLIARIEAGKIDPSYSNVEKLFSALESIKKNSSDFKAKDLMSKKVASVSSKEKILKTVKIMKKRGISQLPVLQDGKVIGLVDESTISSSIEKNLSTTNVEEIMTEPPPMISSETNVAMLSSMLQFNQCLLVTKKGKIVGIISRADILKTLV